MLAGKKKKQNPQQLWVFNHYNMEAITLLSFQKIIELWYNSVLKCFVTKHFCQRMIQGMVETSHALSGRHKTLQEYVPSLESHFSLILLQAKFEHKDNNYDVLAFPRKIMV